MSDTLAKQLLSNIALLIAYKDVINNSNSTPEQKTEAIKNVREVATKIIVDAHNKLKE